METIPPTDFLFFSMREMADQVEAEKRAGDGDRVDGSHRGQCR